MRLRPEVVAGLQGRQQQLVVQFDPVLLRPIPQHLNLRGVDGVLRRLEQDGLVTARLTPSASGPARKYYSITPKGRTDLDAADAEWSRLTRVVNRLLEMRNGHD